MGRQRLRFLLLHQTRLAGSESSGLESIMPYPDYAAVDELVHGACASAGFVYTDRNGDEQIDDEAMKDAVYQRLLKDHVVSEPSDLTVQAVTQHELYEETLPNAPGARRQPASVEERLARDRLMRKLWGFTNTGVTGYCNKRVEAEGQTYVLCETEVGRTFISEETGRPKPTTEPGRFFTDHPDLISQHSTLPRTFKLTKAADAVARHMAMALRRHPELGPVVARQAAAALKQTQATLSPIADAKAAAALTVAKAEDDVA